MESGTVQTLQLSSVPPPRRDPDAEPVQAAEAAGEEGPVPRGAKVTTSETPIASTSAQVGVVHVLAEPIFSTWLMSGVKQAKNTRLLSFRAC